MNLCRWCSARRWRLTTVIGLGAWLFVSPAQAQITPDATLGSENSRFVPNHFVHGNSSDRIEGGALRGVNLFHSFAEFNVNEGQRVYFSNPSGVANILSRVTGRDVSNILGTLGVDGAANLFLLNPNGIVFGANARLDVSGSFVASTGDRFSFSDGSEFSATNPQAAPLLTVNVPIGLQVGTQTGTIVNRGSLATGQDLTLTAANLDLEGQLQSGHDLTLQAQGTLQIRDTVTTPFIATAGRNALIRGDQAVDIVALSHPDSGLFAGNDLTLRSATTVNGDIHYWSGGNVRIEQLDGQLGSLYSARDPIIRATGDVSFNSYTGASIHILAGGSVIIPGRVFVTNPDLVNGLVETVILSDGTPVAINGRDRPTVDIRAGVANIADPGLIGDGNFNPPPTIGDAPTRADIQIGTIFTPFEREGAVLLTNQYRPTASSGTIQVGQIDTSTVTTDGGAVIIDSRGDLSLTNYLYTFSETANGGSVRLLADGNIQVNEIDTSTLSAEGGGVVINAGSSLNLSQLLNTSSEFGNSGRIRLVATNDITLDDAFIEASTRDGSQGGDMVIQANRVHLINGGTISSSTFGTGRGGNITIDATSELVLTGVSASGNPLAPSTSRIIALTSGSGDAGSITINAGRVVLQGGAIIASSSGLGLNDPEALLGRISNPQVGYLFSLPDAAGRGGNITINATSVEIGGVAPGLFPLVSRITTSTSSTERAGDLTVNSDRLTITEGALLTTATLGLFDGAGAGGDLRVTARDSIELIGASSNGQFASALSSDTLGSGRAGTLTLETGRLTVRGGAFVSASTFSTARGGSIVIDADRIDLSGTGTTTQAFASGIYAQTFASGDAGDLTVMTDQLTVGDRATITVAANDLNNASIPLELFNIIRHPVLRDRATGDAGTLDLTATNSVVLNTGGNIRASTISDTSARGNVVLRAANSLVVDGGLISASTVDGAGGGLTIQTDQLTLQNGGRATVSSSGLGTAGELEVNARQLSLNNAEITAETQSAQAGGNIQLQSESVRLLNNSQISASTQTGRGGTVSINANQPPASLVALSTGSRISAEAEETGSAGNITVNARVVTIQEEAATLEGDRAGIVASNRSDQSSASRGGITLTGLERLQVTNGEITASTATGRAGAVQIDASDTVQLTGGAIAVRSTNGGDAGELTIQTNQLQAEAGAQVSVSSTATGLAGTLRVSANQVNLSDRAQLTAETQAGRGGNIQLQIVDSLQLTSGSQVSASTVDGQGGTITVNTPDRTALQSVTLGDRSRISAAVRDQGTGSAGNVSIAAREVTLQGSSHSPNAETGIFASNISDVGNATPARGNVTLTEIDTLQLRNSEISTSTVRGQAGSLTIRTQPGGTVTLGDRSQLASEATAGGTAGSLRLLNAEQLTLSDRARITVSSTDQGAAGDLSLQARQVSLTNQSSITANTEAGQGGNLTLSGMDSLQMRDSEISTSTRQGRAGNLTITTLPGGQIDLDDNSRIAAEAGPSERIETVANRVPIAGNLTLTSDRLTIRNNSAVTVSSRTGQAGSLSISARQVRLNNGRIEAETGFSPDNAEGANIQLQELDLLVMRNGSVISAQALGDADGGNLEIDATGGYAIALPFENSDIIATAERGTGGNIRIQANRIFGFFNQTDAQLDFDQLRSNQTSDISASSEFGAPGVITFDVLGIDPSQGLTELPSTVVDASRQIAQGCGRGSGVTAESLGEFVITGRGGLPPDPLTQLSRAPVAVDLVTREVDSAASLNSGVAISSSSGITEATGWSTDSNGEIILTAQLPSSPAALNDVACPATP